MQVIFPKAQEKSSFFKQHTRLPSFARVAHPPSFQLTARDGAILETMYRFDGIIADYQITTLFFDSATRMKARMSLLFQNGYVARLDRQQRAQLPYMVYWLDRKGIEYVAQHEGVEVNELHWRRPGERWALVPHDIELADFRLSVERSRQELTLPPLEWIGESEFRAHPDRVSFVDRTGKRRVRGIRPDGYFLLRVGKGAKRYWVELDRRTMQNPRFVDEKVRPQLAFLETPLYRERFGHNTGSFLVVTTGKRRAMHMKEQVERAKLHHAHFWHFTIREQVASCNVLTAPIWLRPGSEHPVALLDGITQRPAGARQQG